MKLGSKRGHRLQQLAQLITFMLICLGLNACLGCLQTIAVQVQSNTDSAITIVSVEEFTLHDGVPHVERRILGTVSPGSTQTFDKGLLKRYTEYVLEIQNTSGKAIGEVRQSGDAVYSKLDGRTWAVKIPDDMSPLPPGQTQSAPPQ